MYILSYSKVSPHWGVMYILSYSKASPHWGVMYIANYLIANHWGVMYIDLIALTGELCTSYLIAN